jgi:hypothetical protein
MNSETEIISILETEIISGLGIFSDFEKVKLYELLLGNILNMFLVYEHHARSYSRALCKICGAPGKTCAWCWDGAVYLNVFLVHEHYARSYSRAPCKTCARSPGTDLRLHSFFNFV